MPKQPDYEISDVKPITFERFFVQDDGERIIFEIRDKNGIAGHIAVDWLNLGLTVQLIGRAAE